MSTRIPGITLDEHHWHTVTLDAQGAPTTETTGTADLEKAGHPRRNSVLITAGGVGVTLALWILVGGSVAVLWAFGAIVMRAILTAANRPDKPQPLTGPAVHRTDFLDPNFQQLTDQLTNSVALLAASPLADGTDRAAIHHMLTTTLYNALDELRDIEATGDAASIPDDLLEASGDLEDTAARAADIAGIVIPLPVMDDPQSVRDLDNLVRSILAANNV